MQEGGGGGNEAFQGVADFPFFQDVFFDVETINLVKEIQEFSIFPFSHFGAFVPNGFELLNLIWQMELVEHQFIYFCFVRCFPDLEDFYSVTFYCHWVINRDTNITIFMDNAPFC